MDKQLIWFENLYDTYSDAIWRHLFFKLGDHERAKELMQDVFMKTWEYAQAGNQIKEEKAFLYRTATNLFINEIRTDRKTVSLATLEDAGFEFKDSSDTSTEAISKELTSNLSKINENYRTALTMRYIDGLSVKEIAELLGENETNISMRLIRGIEALKNEYEQPK